MAKKLTVETNRHPNCDGSSWGWIEGCSKNICWSNNKKFNKEKAIQLVKRYNRMFVDSVQRSHNSNKHNKE
jgi:hypothetical protein